jgi:uncharacterized membrane protein
VYAIPPQVAFGEPSPLGSGRALWLLLHQQGVISLFGDSVVLVLYPLIPWVGVMAAGWAFGSVYSMEADRRRKILYATGIAAIALFIFLRFVNIYGDPSPWSFQENGTFTLLSFLNTTKYPPSLLFLMMTLGPSIVVLALTDKIDGRAIWQKICITYGRVPMFFYILQWMVAHGAGVVLSAAAGKEFAYLLTNPGPTSPVPPDAGFSLTTVYAVWLAGLAILYPLCLWYGNYKRRSRHWLLSYL